MLRRAISAALVMTCSICADPHPAWATLSMAESAVEALDANLDLLARRRGLAAAREEVALARSSLLPQVRVGARAQAINDDRADGDRGTNKSESIVVAAGVEQQLYDEEAWARFRIEEFVYEGEVRGLQAFELAIVQEVANAFLALGRAERVLEIQRRNRELTRENRETSESRIAAGWSSDREILRWDVQLAGNETDVRAARVDVLQSRFELNRVRNRPPEEEETIQPATIEEYGFAYARSGTAAAIASPEADRRLRDVLVRFGLSRSPDLAAIDASIAAAERQLVANKRAFWLPTFTVSAGVDHLASQNEGDDVKVTEWGVRGEVRFPLYQGGAKIAGLDQARENLSSLRFTRRAATRTLEQTIRAAFARASGSFESVAFARNQAEAARHNFDLVDASYTLGVASILDLLDAQQQMLTADITVANAEYGFLVDLIAAERALNFYPFLESETQVGELLSEIEEQLETISRKE